MFKTLLANIRHRRNDKQVFPLVVTAASAVAALTSLWIGLRQSVWFDEAYSILIAKQPIGTLVHLVSLDAHPPLYYLVLKGWATMFGWSELSLRSLSALALMLALVVAGLLLKKMFDTRVAIGAILLLMISPLLIRYGFEIRMYSLGMLVGVGATYALYSSWRDGADHRRKWLILYGLLVVTGMFTLYPLALLWLSHVVWIFYVHAKQKGMWKRLVPYILAYVGALLLFLTWLPTFISQLTNGSLAPIGQPMNLENIIGIVSFNSLYSPLWKLSVIPSVIVLAVIMSVVYFAVAARSVLSKKRQEVALLATYILVPVIILMIASLAVSMYVERYLVHVAIGLIMLVGAVSTLGLLNTKGRLRIAAATALYGSFLIGCMTLSSVGNYNFQRLQTITVRQAATQIARTCDTKTFILAADPYVATELSYYLSSGCTLHFVSQYDTLKGGYAPFSGSSLQIKSTDSLKDQDILYIYYGTPDQQMPSSYTQVHDSAYSALHVSEYQHN